MQSDIGSKGMKVSIVTVCRNASDSILDTILSVRKQTHPNIQHIFVDGASTDRTVEIISNHDPDVLVSEPDNGIYDAMQKSIAYIDGDVVYFLNSGDMFVDNNVVSDVVNYFIETRADAVFGNLLPVYSNTVQEHDHPAFKSGKTLDLGYFGNRRLFYDESIHHQAIFYRRELVQRCGFKARDPRADGEYHLNMCAFVAGGARACYLPRTITRFALGGHSTSDFTREWARFSDARDLLRREFFPAGRNISGVRYDEYLILKPNWRNRIGLLLHTKAGRFLQAGLARIRRLRAS
ncbi:glycosyltransferase [Mesorhizobium sp. 1B3]|uniref:glycosyltransferase n=1 Tax=Mesorhizobium sp. 1B3 TaxID=3243599 RepID=UPI003D972C49